MRAAYGLRNWYSERFSLPREVQAARTTEMKRRNAKAQRRAEREVASLHRDTYRRFYQQHLDRVYAELGPLPGDAS